MRILQALLRNRWSPWRADWSDGRNAAPAPAPTRPRPWRSATARAACGTVSRTFHRAIITPFPGLGTNGGAAPERELISWRLPFWRRGRAAGADGRRNSAYGHCPRWLGPSPSRLSAPIVVRIDADNVELVEVAKLGSSQLLQFAAEHQMQKLFLSVFLGHDRS